MKITVTEDMRACLLRIHDAHGVIGDSKRPMPDYVQAWTDIREAQEKLARLMAQAVTGPDASCVFCQQREGSMKIEITEEMREAAANKAPSEERGRDA